ncbi:MAG: GDSL-type esterase/lipase family protein [Bacteroidales bacterium]|nr:GDSL-type esterase/lipase family protein [Bacteroidales bacterium]
MRLMISAVLLLMFNTMIAQTKTIDADNPAFTYSGRVDYTKQGEVRYDWSGIAVYFKFTGDELAFLIEGGKRNYFNLFIDEELHEVMHVPGDTVYSISGIKGKGWHTCRLQKRTEGEMGTTVFKGVQVGVRAKVAAYEALPKRKIEFVGNSITCGYGTEGKSPEEDFLPETENVNLSYAFITARAFDAECYVTAHSGLGVVRNYGDKKKVSTELATLPQRYHQTLDMDTAMHWEFAKWRPDAVVVNLGTNDYSTNVQPDKAVFIDRYRQFIRQIRLGYGDVPIFCVSGPMVNEPAYSNVKEMVESSCVIYNDRNLFFIGIPTFLLNKTTDLGSDYHPSYKGQLKMAGHIIPTIANVLQWNYNDEEFK